MIGRRVISVVVCICKRRVKFFSILFQIKKMASQPSVPAQAVPTQAGLAPVAPVAPVEYGIPPADGDGHRVPLSSLENYLLQFASSLQGLQQTLYQATVVTTPGFENPNALVDFQTSFRIYLFCHNVYSVYFVTVN